ncbi:hypothetical protein PIB30_000004 [Stylosanthes scabra]|uniref:Transposase (Putative), gypsy type n=1 Tax=Stylosanthes scabra TaxID=79078 RepID=A0ABU6Q1R4_9FABA|nr:hypothetical protein [Stylosanthes scabra]
MVEPQGDEVVREVEAAQMPHELNPLYHWVTWDVMGSPCTLTEEYLAELKGGGEPISSRASSPRGEGKRGYVYRVRRLDTFHPFQQRLLQHCFFAPFQFHPNAWSTIRCFELVTEFLELPQDPEYRRIFGLYEESFHDFNGRYFKVFPVGDHPPFWLTLERDAGRFPSYWSKDAGLNYVPVSYKRVNEEQRDIADVLLWLFSKQNLKPKAILGNPERARATIVKMAGKKKTLANLRRAMVANPQGPIILSSSADQASSSFPEGGSSSNVEGGAGNRPEVSSPIPEEVPKHQVEIPPSSSSLGKRGAEEAASAQKRPRVSEGSQRDFCPMDRSFDASGYIEANFLGPRAVEVLRDYDPMKSLRWVEWAVLRSATIMKSIEPRLTLADQWEHRCVKLTGDLKLLNQQKADVEKEKEEVEAAKSKADKDLESGLADSKEKGVELQRLRDREASLLADLRSAEEKLMAKKSRADLAEASLAATEQARRELVKLAEDSVKATEDALTEQILLLAPDFDVSLIGA